MINCKRYLIIIIGIATTPIITANNIMAICLIKENYHLKAFKVPLISNLRQKGQV